MAVTVPIDLDVQGGGLADAINDDLRDARRGARRSGAAAGDAFGDGFERSAASSVAEIDALLSEVTRNRNTSIDVDIDGAGQLPVLETALEAVEGVHTARVEVDVDRDAMAGVARAASQAAGGTSSAFSDAFSLIARNAVIALAAVTAAMYALPVAGAVAATGIVLAFGAGIAGIGILAAAQSEEVQKAFKGMADGIVRDMRRIAAPLEGTLIAISRQITRTFDVFAPALQQSFAQMAPALTQFSDQFFRAFENLEPAIAPLTTAFTDLLGAIGPRLDGFFTNLSDSITSLSDTISSDPDLFAGLFVGLLNLIPALLNGINGLAQAFVFVYELVQTELAPAFADFQASMAPLTALFSDATGGMSLFQAAIAATGAVLTFMVQRIADVLTAISFVANLTRASAAAVVAAWNQVSASTASAWGRVKATVTGAVNAVRGAVSRATANVVALFSGAWARVRAATSSAMATVRGVVSSGMNTVRSVVTGALARVRAAFSAGFNAARAVVTGAMGRIRAAVSTGISSVVSVVSGLPGRIRGALGNLGSMLFSSGYSMISGLAEGIRAGIGNAVSAASSALGAVRNLFPFSPAKEGPFSGTGYTTYSGEALMRDFVKSMEDTANASLPDVSGALDPIANAFPSVAPRQSNATVTNTTVNQGIDPSGLAGLLGGLQVIVRPGMDRRATAELWLNGKRYAEALA